MNSCEFILIHHSVFRQPVQFDLVNASHKARGFTKSSLGYYVGYHYFIGMDGTIKVARREWEIGCHCAAKMMNYKAIGICLAGDFREGRVPTPQQVKSLALLLKDIQSRHAIANKNVLRHGEVKPTACPGEWDFRETVAAYWRGVTQEDETARRIQDRFTENEAEYQKAITIPDRNRFQRILDRIRRVAAEYHVALQ